MALFSRAGYCARLGAVILLSAGCTSAKPRIPQHPIVEASRPKSVPVQARKASTDAPQTVVHAVRRLPEVEDAAPIEPVALVGAAELSLPELLRDVEAR